MNEFTEIFQRIDIENISSFLLYGVETNEDITEFTKVYAEKMAESYVEVYKNLKRLFPDKTIENDSINDAIAHFTSVHCESYFQIGIIVGFRLYKIMEQRYKENWTEDMDEFIKKYAVFYNEIQEEEVKGEKSAYRQGFEDAKKHILECIWKL